MRSRLELKELSADEFLELVEKASPEELDALLLANQTNNLNLKPVQRTFSLNISEMCAAVGRALLETPAGPRTVLSVIGWWEARRLIFNMIVGFVGLVTLEQMIGFAPRSSLYQAAFVYGIMANACYTLGWLAELVARFLWKDKAEHFGGILLSLGLLFSVALTIAPAAMLFIVNIFRIFS